MWFYNLILCFWGRKLNIILTRSVNACNIAQSTPTLFFRKLKPLFNWTFWIIRTILWIFAPHSIFWAAHSFSGPKIAQRWTFSKSRPYVAYENSWLFNVNPSSAIQFHYFDEDIEWSAFSAELLTNSSSNERAMI